jgi:Xaa-Pro aminopeptidase
VQGGAIVREDLDPVTLPKAKKNAVEIEGFRQAHRSDGVALTRFLHWFAIEAPKGELTEMSTAARLNAFRRELPELHEIACPPISATDANAAKPHYWPTEAANAPVTPHSLYLNDSGGQYRGGTTDVTRTVMAGDPTAEMKDRFTRVLKGHIAMAEAVFPVGTHGNRIDALARFPLWAAGLDYAHGTGHGVGHFLNIHEGPAYLTQTAFGDFGIQAGMVLSNEPGYYKEGEYGIRIESMVVALPADIAGAEKPMLRFETLTMAPIARQLIDMELLTAAEIAWVDAYHAEVLRRIGPRLPDETRLWLEVQTAPLAGQR